MRRKRRKEKTTEWRGNENTAQNKARRYEGLWNSYLLTRTYSPPPGTEATRFVQGLLGSTWVSCHHKSPPPPPPPRPGPPRLIPRPPPRAYFTSEADSKPPHVSHALCVCVFVCVCCLRSTEDASLHPSERMIRGGISSRWRFLSF